MNETIEERIDRCVMKSSGGIRYTHDRKAGEALSWKRFAYLCYRGGVQICSREVWVGGTHGAYEEDAWRLLAEWNRVGDQQGGALGYPRWVYAPI